MNTYKGYTEESSTVILAGKEYQLTNLTPNLEATEKEKTKLDTNSKLFKVFRKYI